MKRIVEQMQEAVQAGAIGNDVETAFDDVYTWKKDDESSETPSEVVVQHFTVHHWHGHPKDQIVLMTVRVQWEDGTKTWASYHCDFDAFGRDILSKDAMEILGDKVESDDEHKIVYVLEDEEYVYEDDYYDYFYKVGSEWSDPDVQSEVFLTG